MAKCFLELTSFRFSRSDHRLIEICAVRMESGRETSRLESLVNPGRPLPCTTVNGLDYRNRLLARSPTFCGLVDELWPLLEGAVVVGIEIESKAAVLRGEFKKIGVPVAMRTIDIGEISNMDLPDPGDGAEFIGTSPKSLTLGERVKVMMGRFPESIENIVSGIPCRLPPTDRERGSIKDGTGLADGLPSLPGVYFFRDGEGRPLYIGKAVSIRKRVLSHLRSKASRELELATATKSIDCVPTGCDLVAQLLEAHEIVSHEPEFNRAQLLPAMPYQIVHRTDSKGYIRIYSERKTYSDSAVNYFSDRKSVMARLEELCRDYLLCRKFCGLERTSGACSLAGTACDGACLGKVGADAYNARAHSAIESLGHHRSFAILESGRDKGERSFVMVLDGFYHGFGHVPITEAIASLDDLEPFLRSYPNTYYTARIVASYLRRRKRPELIGPLADRPDSLYCNG